jgi:hypothetical protein
MKMKMCEDTVQLSCGVWKGFDWRERHVRTSVSVACLLLRVENFMNVLATLMPGCTLRCGCAAVVAHHPLLDPMSHQQLVADTSGVLQVAVAVDL